MRSDLARLVNPALTAAIVVVALALCGQLVFGAPSDHHPALVRLSSGCSGVCVSPDGLVVTACHCPGHEKVGESTTVRFSDGTTYSGSVVYVPEEDDLSVIRIQSASGLPFAPVATHPPAIGDPVWSEGYNAHDQHSRMEGRVIRIATGTYPRSRFRKGLLKNTTKPFITLTLIETNHNIAPGNSGGPLFNANGEVVGIGSMSSSDPAWQSSLFMHTTSIRAAVAAAGGRLDAGTGVETLPAFVCVVSDGCLPCERYQRDYKADTGGLRTRLSEAYNVQILRAQQASNIIRKYKLHQWPSFVDTSSGMVYIGYTGPEQMLKVLNLDGPRAYQREQPQVIVLDDAAAVQQDAQEVPPASTTESASSTPASNVDEEEQRSYVHVVVLGDKLDVGLFKGLALGLAEGKIKAYIEPIVHDAFGGAVTMDFVFRRNEPDRYEAVIQTTGISVRFGTVLLMVQKQASFDFISERIAKLEGFIRGLKDERLKNIPVEVVFQRETPELYDAVRAGLAGSTLVAANADMPPAKKEDDDLSSKMSWWNGLLALIGLAEGGPLRSRLRKLRGR